MTSAPSKAALALLAASMVLQGCAAFNFGGDSAEEVQEADFSSAWEGEDNREKLARPPNVISDVEQSLLRIGEGGADRLLPEIAQARIAREGLRYWLEVDLEPELVWNLSRDFWINQGFSIDTELPEAGIMETDWRQDRSKVLGTGLTRFLDIALERLHDTGERYRFRTRIERGDKPGTSVIFISYRAIQENLTGGNEFEALPYDPTLEAEMLRRMLLAFRLPEESLATLEDFDSLVEDQELYELEGDRLTILRGKEEAWSRVLQALDRGGYIIDSSDKEAGTIMVHTANPLSDPEEVGFISRLFGQDDTFESVTATVSVEEIDEQRTAVQVVSNEETSGTILKILADNL